jgi:hypothetical protein
MIAPALRHLRAARQHSVSCWCLSSSFTPGVIEVVPSSGLTNVSAITVGVGFHQFALMPKGTVRCWGLNDDGELGGFFAPCVVRPQQRVLPRRQPDGHRRPASDKDFTRTTPFACWGHDRRRQFFFC